MSNRFFAALGGIILFFFLPAKVLWAQPDSVRLVPPAMVNLDSIAKSQVDLRLRVYRHAHRMGDWQTALSSLTSYLVENPINAPLQDTLAMLYLRTGNTLAALRWANECLQERPQEAFLLQLTAGIYESMGDHAEAVNRYGKLYTLRPSSVTRYLQATNEYLLGRYGESANHVGEILADPASESMEILIHAGEATEQVALRAAALNLQGMIHLQMGSKPQAKSAFKKALEIDPDFSLPKNNLDAL